MRMLVGRPQLAKDGFEFNLDGARPAGPQTVIRAAKDPVAREPQDEEIKALLQRTLTRAKLNDDSTAWEVTGVTGERGEIPLGAPLAAWVQQCEKLLVEAMTHE